MFAIGIYPIRAALCISIVLSALGWFTVADAQIITGSAATDAVQQLNGAGALDPDRVEPVDDPRLVVATVIRYFLSLLGTILLILIVMSGYWYFTARGDDEKITRAQTTIKQALMGMIIITGAYAVTIYTINSLTTTLKEGDQDRVRDEYRLGDIINAGR